MTDQTDTAESLDEALEAHDVTRTLTRGQVLLVAIGALLLVRILRGRVQRARARSILRH